MQAWLANMMIGAMVLALRKSIEWFLSPSHAQAWRETLRSHWWTFHQKTLASKSTTDDSVAVAFQIFFNFIHSPSEKALLNYEAPESKPPPPYCPSCEASEKVKEATFEASTKCNCAL